MKVGLIVVGFNMKENLSRCLTPWGEARQDNLGGHEFVICVVSLPFVGFPNEGEDGTVKELQTMADYGEIDKLITQPENIPEATARSMALNYVRWEGCDVSWMVDLDEFYTAENITRILEFVVANPWVDWFRLSLKNYVLDDKTYLIEPFQPPRIHRLRSSGGQYEAYSFSADNDIVYAGKTLGEGDLVSQSQLSSLAIPKEVAWVMHESWPNSIRSKKKIEYQLAGRGWPQCSFSWDDSQGGLIFNPELPKPKMARD